MAQRNPKLELIFFDAGGGHRAAARALAAAIQARHGWEVVLHNLQETLDPIDVMRRWFRVRMQDVYNTLLRREVTRGLDHLLTVLHFVIRANHRRIVRLLEPRWDSSQPDVVVSLVPHFNRAILESLQASLPNTELVTVLTDLADYPPHFWIEKQDQHVVCGTERAVDQALDIGLDPGQILPVSGMIIHPSFYASDDGGEQGARAGARDLLGFDPDIPTGLVVFGGQGSHRMLRVAREIEASRARVQMIYVCGRNDRLRKSLRALPTRYKKHVIGFTTEMRKWMARSDFFVGKAGPGSISEALVSGLPLLIDGRGGYLPQERFNIEWIRQKAVGLVVDRGDEFIAAFTRLIAPDALAAFRERVADLDNRAVFETVDHLEALLERSMTPSRAIAS